MNEEVISNTMNNSFRSELINALLDIRLALSIKKIVSNFISKKDFEKMLNDQKEKNSDIKLNEELDKIFEEYLPSKIKSPLENSNQMRNDKDIAVNQNLIDAINEKVSSLAPKENDVFSLEDMEKSVNNDYSDNVNSNNGRLLIKRNDNFKTTSTDEMGKISA